MKWSTLHLCSYSQSYGERCLYHWNIAVCGQVIFRPAFLICISYIREVKGKDGCPGLLSVAVIKTITKNNLGKNRFASGWYWGKSDPEPGGRSCSRDHGRELLTGFLSIICSACFLVSPMTTCPGVTLSPVNWAFPYQLLIKKMSSRLAYRPAFYGNIFSVRMIPSSQMCWVCTKLTKIQPA